MSEFDEIFDALFNSPRILMPEYILLSEDAKLILEKSGVLKPGAPTKEIKP